jgi:hypothetical protein
MALSDKVEAVSKVSETKGMNSIEETERLAPNKEHFDNLMQTTNPIKSTSFERLDTKAFKTEEVQKTETNPIFGDENVTSQKSGSATDQERKRRQQEAEEADEVGSVKSKKSASSEPASLMDEVSRLNKNVSGLSGASPESIKAQAKDSIEQIEKVKATLSQATGEIKPSYQTLLRSRLGHIDDNLKIALNKAGVEYTPPQATGTENKSAIHKFISMLNNSEHQLKNLGGVVDQLGSTGEISPSNMLAIQMKMGYVQQQIELFTNLLNKALESTKTIMNVQV